MSGLVLRVMWTMFRKDIGHSSELKNRISFPINCSVSKPFSERPIRSDRGLVQWQGGVPEVAVH